jgi:hypothetical protein
MKAHPVALVAAAALLTGCGAATTDAAKDPSPTTRGPNGTPHWPTEGCDVHSASSIDYASDSNGAHTPEEALASYTPAGTTVVREKRRPHREARWLVVDEDHVIVRAVSMFEGSHGWLVDGVEECSG